MYKPFITLCLLTSLTTPVLAQPVEPTPTPSESPSTEEETVTTPVPQASLAPTAEPTPEPTPVPTQPPNPPEMRDIIYMIEQDFGGNYEKIMQLTPYMKEEQRLIVFNEKKKSPWVGSAVNLIVGFGVGSFLGGDGLGGLIELAGEVGSILLINAANGAGREPSFNPWVVAGAVGGVVSFLGFRAYGVFQPFGFTTEYNTQLRKAMTLPDSVPVSLEPYLYTRPDSAWIPVQEAGLKWSLSY